MGTSIGVVVSEVIMKQFLSILPESIKESVKSVIEIFIVGSISIVMLYTALKYWCNIQKNCSINKNNNCVRNGIDRDVRKKLQ